MSADVDTLLLDRVFQPLADRGSSATTCFGLARLALATAVALQTMVLVDDLLLFADPFTRALAGAIAVLAFVGADQGRRMISRVERQSRSGLMNIRRITLRGQRWAWLAITGWTVATACMRQDTATAHVGLSSLAWLAAIYFASCTPKPPGLTHQRRRSTAHPLNLSRCLA